LSNELLFSINNDNKNMHLYISDIWFLNIDFAMKQYVSLVSFSGWPYWIFSHLSMEYSRAAIHLKRAVTTPPPLSPYSPLPVSVRLRVEIEMLLARIRRNYLESVLLTTSYGLLHSVPLEISDTCNITLSPTKLSHKRQKPTERTLGVGVLIEVETGVFEHAVPLAPRLPLGPQLDQVAETIGSGYGVGRRRQVLLRPFEEVVYCLTVADGSGHHLDPPVEGGGVVRRQVQRNRLRLVHHESVRLGEAVVVVVLLLHLVVEQHHHPNWLFLLQRRTGRLLTVLLFSSTHRISLIVVKAIVLLQAKPATDPLVGGGAARIPALFPQVPAVEGDGGMLVLGAVQSVARPGYLKRQDISIPHLAHPQTANTCL
jgi:hypothetical protein